MGNALGWAGITALALIGVNAVVQAERRRAARVVTIAPAVLAAVNNAAIGLLIQQAAQGNRGAK